MENAMSLNSRTATGITETDTYTSMRRSNSSAVMLEMKEIDAIYARFRLIFMLTNTLTILLAAYVVTQLLFKHQADFVSARFRAIGLSVLLGAAILLSIVQWLCLRQTTLNSRHRIEKMMYTDGLTHVFNYRYLERCLEEEIESARRAQSPLAVVYMDLDHFKRVNDECGHEFGNIVLAEFGRFLRHGSRATDLIGRIGGDEFLIVLPHTALEQARLVSERIRKRVEAHVFELQGRKVDCIRVSMGIACFPDDGQDKQTLISVADKAMYKAKGKGGNAIFAANTLATATAQVAKA